MTKVFFHKSFHEPIYIMDDKPIEYKCDGKEGSIYFNGYYYVEDGPPSHNTRYDKWLPENSNNGCR